MILLLALNKIVPIPTELSNSVLPFLQPGSLKYFFPFINFDFS